jgi:nucleoside-diphosphate-sugar epimerase
MARYLVTGAAGFIGARTAELLLQDGHMVVGIDNMNEAYDPLIKEYRLKHLRNIPGFSFHKLDVSERSVIEQFKHETFDAVINLAARAGAGVVQADRDEKICRRLHLLHLWGGPSLPDARDRLQQ